MTFAIHIYNFNVFHNFTLFFLPVLMPIYFHLQRPADVIFRKRPSSVWFPYTAIERLWCQLERAIALGHMVEQSKKLQSLLHGALSSHLKQVTYLDFTVLFCPEKTVFRVLGDFPLKLQQTLTNYTWH